MADVILFEDKNFQGRRQALGIGLHRLDAAGLDNAASSIKVPRGLVALVHDEADASGGYGVFADFLEDHSDLSVFGLENAISHVRVFEVSRHGYVWLRNRMSRGQFVPGHWARMPASGPPVNPTAVVSPTPHGPNLLYMRKLDGTPWTNPRNPLVDTSDPNWSRKVVFGATFDGSKAHPFEWVSVLNPKVEQDDQVGLTGRVTEPHQSGADLPFTHPFGRDFEFSIIPDHQYAGLLAHANADPDGVYKSSWASAHRAGLAVPDGILGLEVDGALVPPEYRYAEGDRVAVYGRWIVDAGHPEFHTEIHPPLLMARARCVDDHDRPTLPSASATTHFQLWGRPYQSGQLFKTGGDSGLPLREYAKRIAETLPGHIEAFPPIFDNSFRGIHLIPIAVDPPVLRPKPPSRLPQPGQWQLECSYHFITNGACTIEVIKQPWGDGADGVLVLLALNYAGLPKLPEPPHSFDSYTISGLLAEAPGGADLSGVEEALVSIHEHTVNRVKVRRFAPPATPGMDSSGEVPFTPLASLPRSTITKRTDQPFPILGWLKLKWVNTGVSAGTTGSARGR